MRHIPIFAFASAISAASAAELAVTFDAALTNGTGWTYSAQVKYAKEKRGYALTAQNARILSARLNLYTTSVVVRAFNTSANATSRRNLVVAAWRDGEPVKASEQRFVCETNECDYSVAWPADARYDRLAFFCDAGKNGYTYLRTATLGGLTCVETPGDFAVSSCSHDTCVFSWTPDPSAFRTDVSICRITFTPASWTDETRFDWDDLVPSSDSYAAQTALFLLRNPTFTGQTLSCKEAGVLQLGSTDNRGWLGFAAPATCTRAVLGLRMRHYDGNDENDTTTVCWTRGETTNVVATISLGTSFADHLVSLDDVPQGSTLLLNATGATTRHRIQLDALWTAANYQAANVMTNGLTTSSCVGGSATFSDLTPDADYTAWAVSYDFDAHQSEIAGPLVFRTGKRFRGMQVLMR